MSTGYVFDTDRAGVGGQGDQMKSGQTGDSVTASRRGVPAAEKSDLTDRLPSGQDYSQCDE